MSNTNMALTKWLFLTPAFLGLFLFMIVPFFTAITLSFTDQKLLSPKPTGYVGLRNYERLLGLKFYSQEPVMEDGQIVMDNGNYKYPKLRTAIRANPEYKGYRELTSARVGETKYILLARDVIFWKSTYNILRFVVMVLPLQLCLALAMALLINKPCRGRVFFRTLFFAPVVTSMVVVSILWIYLYGEKGGFINTIFSFLSFGAWENRDFLSDTSLALPAIVAMSAWQGAGFQMIIFLAGLQNIPEERYEAAEIDGANNLRKFWHVTIPGLKNTITFVVISTTLQAFMLFVQIDIMTKGGPQDTTSTIMFHAVKRGFEQQDIAYSSAISVVYFMTLLIIAFAQKNFLEKR